MGAVLKSGKFVFVTGAEPQKAMRPPVIGVRLIDNGERNTEPVEFEPEEFEQEEIPETEEERLERERREENERIRQQYVSEGEKLLADTEKRVKNIIEEAEASAQLLTESTEAECAGIKAEAEKSGYDAGYEKGMVAGNADGYEKGLAACKEALDALSAALNSLPAEKEQIYTEYENQLFDLIFIIANKITINSLKQKDKAVISKMLKEAAKDFRGSSYIKVSLSKHDVKDDINADVEDLKRIIGNENAHIEFEVLKDAADGTLILDNGSEITDAGIQTQLKMIESLGKGRFKSKNPEEDE